MSPCSMVVPWGHYTACRPAMHCTDRIQLRGQVVDLDHGKAVAELTLSGMSRHGQGITRAPEGRTVFAIPHLKDARVTLIDVDNCYFIKEI